MKKPLFIIFLILIVDQTLKIWIKTHMYLGQEHHIFGNWFIIHFTENEGMAFGMKFGGEYGKLILSIFRIIAVIAIGWYLYRLGKKGTPFGLMLCISLILAGAIGNIIDSAFYGLLFNDNIYQVATFLPEEGGSGKFLHGRVVDMLYFPIIEGHFPDWFPVWRSEKFIFFRPVFNIADSSITIGVLSLVFFQRKFFKKQEEDAITDASTDIVEPQQEETPV